MAANVATAIFEAEPNILAEDSRSKHRVAEKSQNCPKAILKSFFFR